MDETPPPSGHDVERELRARVAVGEPELERTPSPPVRPPLRRRARGKVVAGVAWGLADHWGIPAIVLRIPLAIAGLIWALLLWDMLTNDELTYRPDTVGIPDQIALLSFAAIVAYVVLWIVLPREDVARSPARRVTERYPGIRSIPGFVLLAVGGAILADRLGIWEPDLVLAAALIALGVWLYRRDRASAADTHVVERTPQEGETVAVEPAGPSRSPARIARPPRERSPLGWITFGAALLVVCVAAIWTSLAAETLSTVHRGIGLTRISTIPALGLLVLAAGLLVGSVFGRARWLILPALLLTPIVLLASLITMPLEGRFGDVYVRSRNLAEIRSAQYLSVGRISVDLTRLDRRPDIERELSLSTVIGDVSVYVPYDAHVRVDARAGLGTLSLGRVHREGMEISAAARLEPKYGDGATFTFHIDIGIGNVSVYRYPPTKRELREIRQQERRAERVGAREGEAA